MTYPSEILRYERIAAWRSFEAALAALPIPAETRVLDLGCGSGVVSRLLVERFAAGPVVGVDLNPAYVVAARSLAAERQVPRVNFVAGDARQLPFPDDTFDLLWTAFVVEYLAADIPTVLAELTRVVRPGGVVAVFDVGGFLLHHDPIDPDLAARIARWQQFVQARGFDPEIGPKLPSYFAAAGFRDVQAQTFPDPELYPIGNPGDAILSAWQQRLAGMQGLRAVFGSDAEADRFRADYLALLRQPERRTSGTNWLVWGKTS